MNRSYLGIKSSTSDNTHKRDKFRSGFTYSKYDYIYIIFTVKTSGYIL